ncbi:MAG: hypothetical protein IPJ84_11335 [Bdellovibrionales bacterium]|nr:hypothetical protein [Bdellovibrionales bacterium]
MRNSVSSPDSTNKLDKIHLFNSSSIGLNTSEEDDTMNFNTKQSTTLFRNAGAFDNSGIEHTGASRAL